MSPGPGAITAGRWPRRHSSRSPNSPCSTCTSRREGVAGVADNVTRRMSLLDLTGGVPGVRHLAPGGRDDPDVDDQAAATPVGAIRHRSGDVAPGDLFACLVGARTDGHEFAADAVARGAAALITEHPLDLPVPQALVPDSRVAMGLAAVRAEGDPSAHLTVVGITGTNGKTTSAYLVRAVLEAAGVSCGLMGTVEIRVGGVS